MRTFGLIAVYMVALFLTGWLLLNMETKSGWDEVLFSSQNHLESGAISQSKKIQSEHTPDSLGNLSIWLKRPIGVVRYPEFPIFIFLTNGN